MTRQTPLSAFAERNKPVGGLAVGLFGVIPLLLFLTFLLLIFTPGVGEGAIILLLPALVAGVLTVRLARKVYSRRTAFYNQNHLDYQGSKVIQKGLPNLGASDRQRSTLNINTKQPEVAVFRGLQLGEISRHFDSQTSGSIEGWLNHNLQVNSSSVSYQLSREVGDHYRGGMSAGNHSTGITGQSSVHLTFSSTTRDNLLADGFVAVLEYETTEGWMDTLRVIVPSEPAMREYVQQYIAQLGSVFEPGTHREAVFNHNAPTLAQQLNTDVSYVSDRLNAILRMPPERRPPVAVVGTAVTGHAIVGGAMHFEGDGNWYQLFPIGLIQKLNALVERSANQQALSN